MKRAPINLQEYDERWPAEFEEERRFLLAVAGEWNHGGVMHWFCKPSDAFRTHHLHLIPFESSLWKERLQFRDLLRSNSQVANDYAGLKRGLAARYVNDREAYTENKRPFISRALGGQLGC